MPKEPIPPPLDEMTRSIPPRYDELFSGVDRPAYADPFPRRPGSSKRKDLVGAVPASAERHQLARVPPNPIRGNMVFTRTTTVQNPRIREYADIIFLMDVTGSMQRYIDKVRETLREITTKVKEAHVNLEPKLAFVGYRDYDDAERFVVQDFTTDVDRVVEFIGGINAQGGGDFPEDVKGGLSEMLKLSWSSRYKILLHIADAPAHGNRFHGGVFKDNHPDGGPGEMTMEEIFQMVTERRIIYNFLRLNKACDTMIVAMNEISKSYYRGREIRVTDLGSSDTSFFVDMMVRSISSSMRVT
ncbi:hypothetical protein HDU97_005807 [Phlyctochytrium planicorne]|nr:hypothetical protein HDU97_005807 [Phlyctochytrium planicorne]